MGRMYSGVFEGVAVTAVQDFFEIVSAADAITILHAVYLSQTSDVGDAAEEMLSVVIQTGATTSGSGGAAVTPGALSLGDPAYGGTMERNNTTEAVTGTILNLHRESFNIRTGWVYIPTPEMRIILSPSARMTITLLTTPADSLTMDGTVYIEEVGG